MLNQIPLTKGAIASVDEDDLPKIGKWKWKLHPQGYASRTRIAQGKSHTILMHRAIMGAGDGEHVHHVDGDKLNNSRSNLKVLPALDHQRLHSHTIVALQKSRQIYPDVKNCSVCGAIFTANPRKRKRQKCCSLACARRAINGTPVPLLRGDVWEAYTNSGTLMRHIRSANVHRVYYLGPYGVAIQSCAPGDFRKWIKRWDATLVSSSNWDSHEAWKLSRQR